MRTLPINESTDRPTDQTNNQPTSDAIKNEATARSINQSISRQSTPHHEPTNQPATRRRRQPHTINTNFQFVFMRTSKLYKKPNGNNRAEAAETISLRTTYQHNGLKVDTVIGHVNHTTNQPTQTPGADKAPDLQSINKLNNQKCRQITTRYLVLFTGDHSK